LYKELTEKRVLEYLEPVVPFFVGAAKSWRELLGLDEK